MNNPKVYEGYVWQDGIAVAGVSGIDKDEVERELQHYALIYSQDGPIEIKRNYKEELVP